jgi:hypothetical protein
MITDTDQLQQHLFEIFQLHRWAPLGNTPNQDPHDSYLRKHTSRSTYPGNSG